jgi:hypothetical protein
MDYKLIYQRLCLRGQTRTKNSNIYLEKHHILPKCLGGDNSFANLTLLTAREHYIAHYLLCKVYNDSNISVRAKLSSAFNRMCTLNTHKRQFTSRQYDVARKYFSENHHMKSKECRDKVALALRKKGIITRQLREQLLPLCKCGCGKKVKNKYHQYLYNHWDRSVTKSGFTEEVRKRLSEKAIKRILSLTDEEKKDRLQKSLHSEKVDHIMRGRKISLSKRGKKTNQQNIMGKRFANMAEDEFLLYLNTVSPKVWTRYTKLRNRCLSKK